MVPLNSKILTSTYAIFGKRVLFTNIAKRTARVKNWPEHCLLGVFLSGLKEELKTDVRIHKPRTVYKAMSLALEFEAKTSTPRGLKVPSWSSSAKPNAVGSFSRPPGSRDLPLSHSAAPANSRAPFTTNPLAPLPTQSRPWDAERQARLAKGLCFRCNEKFQPGHKCKLSSLSLLKITEDESPEHEDAEGNLDNDAADAELAEISFHAILGNSVGATLNLQGEIKERQVLILVDSGSTHNFVSKAIVEELAIPLHTIPSFGVQISNGDIISCNQVCQYLQVKLPELIIT